jgi:DNA-binding response OmpR family regulator
LWRIRAVSQTPIIVVSARETSRPGRRRMGADDYVVKPFGMRAGRPHPCGRGTGRPSPSRAHLGALVGTRSQKVTLAGEPVHLTAKSSSCWCT